MHISNPLLREFAHVVRRKVAAPRQVKVGDPVNKLCGLKQDMPPYPYGPAQFYKQGDRGLYGGKVPQYGHKISDYGNKHVRIFSPNIQKVSLWSAVLKKQIDIRVASTVLKTITREGGLDNYLIKDTPQRIKQLGTRGWQLRYQVLQQLEKQQLTAPQFDLVDGVRVFGKAQLNGQPIDVVVGRTRLAKLCFDYSLDNSLKAHMQKCQAMDFQQLVDLCIARGVSLDKYVK